MNDFSEIISTVQGYVIQYGSKVLLAVLTLIIGLWVISKLTKGVETVFNKNKFDETLQKFLVNLVNIALKAMLLVSIASMIGIETTSFVAIIGAAGLAIGLALQGSLSNFAGGVLVLIFKPYKVGDLIDAQGFLGKVKEIQIFNTIINTPQNRLVIIPNGLISNGCITNMSAEEHIRIDLTFGVGYGDDITKVKSVLEEVVKSDSRIQKDPAPVIAVKEHGASSVNFACNVWAKPADYWGVYFYMHEKVKIEFDKEGISIPFPQRDVHMINS
ncbi:MAG: mechanosensitive ion channel family protein [Calditrichaeota bacterium]|nr:MAG: mechanosensitive ion channel family protein [Calditrichota bacterium]